MTEPIKIQISPKSFLAFTGILAAGYVTFLLWPFLMLFFLSILLATSLEPVVLRLEKHIPRWLSVTCIGVVVGGIFIAIGVLLVPSVYEQIVTTFQKFPEVMESTAQKMPGPLKSLTPYWHRYMKTGSFANPESLVQKFLTFGGMAVDGLTGVFLIYILMLYLLIDGRKALVWFMDFFPTPTRIKMKLTLNGVAPVISAYVLGQLITSVLAFFYTLIALSLLGVPGAVLLALLAGLSDVLPVLGFFIAVIPALIFSVSSGPAVVAGVAGIYVLYHGIESYLILPLVYGNRLRVSGLTILIALIVSGTLFGILGAIAILPVVASFPIVERIWLSKALGEEVIERHKSEE